MDNTCPTSSFDMDLCADKLQSLGIQVFYISLWTNLYSTLQLCSLGHSWGAGVLVTLVALALTALVILVIDGHQRKLNVNTDVRLAAVNEIFIKHSIILGITDVLDGPHNTLQVSLLWFVHFSPEPCLQALAAHITHLQGTQAGLRQRLNKLWVALDVAVQPELRVEEEAPSEESPLLSSKVTLNKDPVICSELLHLIPEGPPQAMAQQLLVIFSACYVRLLVTGRLPRASPGGHLGHSSAPCPCQFIQSTVLHPQHCWGRGS
ncbi:Transmembrane protein C9orf91 [Lonchura striata]|uniref:Transmembrane protein C9orf91 n=1 Tax=Lonchura striata TaxID=40157 RepID=A0A218UAE1_9PASE|nr:Transmembrane protein C9orf91 [Lonchura striata domestica]